jgi:hypothetical protein
LARSARIRAPALTVAEGEARLLYRSHSHRKTIGRHSAARDGARNEQTRDGVDVAGILDKYLATRGERTAARCRPVRGRELDELDERKRQQFAWVGGRTTVRHPLGTAVTCP